MGIQISLPMMASPGRSGPTLGTAFTVSVEARVGVTTGMFPARWQITSYLQTKAGNRACGQLDFLNPQATTLASICSRVARP